VASNCDPPDLSLPASQTYRHEPWHPAEYCFFHSHYPKGFFLSQYQRPLSIIIFFFFETGSHYVTQAGIKLEILLLPLPECRDYSCHNVFNGSGCRTFGWFWWVPSINSASVCILVYLFWHTSTSPNSKGLLKGECILKDDA
jgi:hypothetical protein